MKAKLLKAKLVSTKTVRASYKCEKGEFSLKWSYANHAGGTYETGTGMDWVCGSIDSDNEQLKDFVESELEAGEAGCSDYDFYISIMDSRTDIPFNTDITASEDFLKSLEVTDVQIFQYDYGFSVNFALNNDVLIQFGTDGEWSIPSAKAQYWNHEGMQDLFCEAVSAYDIAEYLELPTDIDDIKEQYSPDFY